MQAQCTDPTHEVDATKRQQTNPLNPKRNAKYGNRASGRRVCAPREGTPCHSGYVQAAGLDLPAIAQTNSK